uniref:Ciliary associated calcium binding coiled-coil 1 n=1 Tax=Canis lupus familiaris TaxID=9615 RepID=A0A8P0SXJ7_CANLF
PGPRPLVPLAPPRLPRRRRAATPGRGHHGVLGDPSRGNDPRGDDPGGNHARVGGTPPLPGTRDPRAHAPGPRGPRLRPAPGEAAGGPGRGRGGAAPGPGRLGPAPPALPPPRPAGRPGVGAGPAPPWWLPRPATSAPSALERGPWDLTWAGRFRKREAEIQEHEKILSPDFLSVAQITEMLAEDVDGVQHLFQHYKLYEFLFYSTREEIVIGTKQVIEVVKPSGGLFPDPLEEGISFDLYSTFIEPPPILDTEMKRLDQKQVLEESQSEANTSDVDPLVGFTIEDIKSVLDQVTDDILIGIQTEINEKLQIQEEAFNARIEKLKKA